jgi:hypothetical protein
MSTQASIGCFGNSQLSSDVAFVGNRNAHKRNRVSNEVNALKIPTNSTKEGYR